MKIKYLPNMLSALRIIGSILLLFINLYTLEFKIIYFLSGLCDILDGFTARKTNTQSIFGAKLDSFADIIMFAIILYIFIPVTILPSGLIIWIIIIALIRLVSIIIINRKYKIVAILHTYGNKLSGLLLFFVPILIGAEFQNIIIYSACIVASISAIEELIINTLSNKLNINEKTIFDVISRNTNI